MNHEYAIAAGVSFIAMLVLSIWPRATLDKAKVLLQARGEDPDQYFGYSKMRQLDHKLARTWMIGFVMSVLPGICFVYFIVAGVLK